MANNPLTERLASNDRPRIVTKDMLFDMAERYNRSQWVKDSGAPYFVKETEEDGKLRYQLARNG